MYPRELEGGMSLRPMTERDLPFMLEIRNESRHLMNDDREFALEDAAYWYHNEHPENYVIVAGGRSVGIMRVRRGKQSMDSVEIGGDIHKDWRGLGYGKRAYHLLIPYLFDNPFVTELYLEVLEINMKAFNLYHKLGFEIHEYRPHMAPRSGDRWLEGFVMNLSREKWENQ